MNERFKAVDGVVTEPSTEREAGGVMTLSKAVHFLGGGWLAERIAKGSPCGCGSCSYCAYKALTAPAPERGNIEAPMFGELVVACVVCKERKPVLLYPHRLDGKVVGWVFVCADDQSKIQNADVQIQFNVA